MACVQPDWSGNIVACNSGAAAAAVDCGKTCWFGGKKWKACRGEEVANGEDEIQLPLPSTATTETGRSYSPVTHTHTHTSQCEVSLETCLFSLTSWKQPTAIKTDAAVWQLNADLKQEQLGWAEREPESPCGRRKMPKWGEKKKKSQAVCGKPLLIHPHNGQPDNILLYYWIADTWKICFHTSPKAGQPHPKPKLASPCTTSSRVGELEQCVAFVVFLLPPLLFCPPSENIITSFSLERYFPLFTKDWKDCLSFLRMGGKKQEGRGASGFSHNDKISHKTVMTPNYQEHIVEKWENKK